MWFMAIVRDGYGYYPLQVFARDAGEAAEVARDQLRGRYGEVDRVVPDHSRMRAEFDECVDRR